MSRTIPRGWTEIEVKDFLKFTPREVEKPKKPYLSLGIRSHFKGTFTRQVENPDKVMMESLYEVKKDDLIVNITFAWEGAVALVKESDEGALVSHRFPTYIFDRKVAIPEFFRYLIPSKRLAYNLGVISPGGAGRNRVLDRTDFLDLQFIMPPVLEQKKIAYILSTWDRGIQILERIIEKHKILRQYYSEQIFGHNSTAINRKMWRSWKLCDLKADMKNSFIDGNWIEAPHLTASGIRFIQTGNIGIGEFRNNNKKYISEKSFKDLKCKEVKVGDILICRLADPIGRCCVVPNLLESKYVTSVDVVIFRADLKKTTIPFIVHYLNSPTSLRKAQVLASGSTRQRISRTTLGKIEIKLPPIEEQNKISSYLTTIQRKSYILNNHLEVLKKQKLGLMQKLLTGKIRVSHGK